jgi:hypothetical protein
MSAFSIARLPVEYKKEAKSRNFTGKMSKGLLLAAALGVTSIFAWKHFSKPETLTPEQEIARLVGRGSFSAVELAEVTDKFPALAAKALRDRRVTVTGVLQKAMVKGVGSHDLILDLEGSRKRKVTFTSDINSYARANNLLGGSKKKFQKHGRDIVVYESRSKGARVSAASGGMVQKLLANVMPAAPSSGPESDAAPEDAGPVERVVFRELDSVTLEGIFQYISPVAIHIEWRPTKDF